MKALIVEDSPTTRLMLSDLLSLEGHTVLVASTGAEALALLEQTTASLPDALIFDLCLPDTTGTALLEQVRERPAWAGIPALLTTAATMPSTSVPAGFAALLLKPYAPEVLMSVLRQITPTGPRG